MNRTLHISTVSFILLASAHGCDRGIGTSQETNTVSYAETPTYQEIIQECNLNQEDLQRFPLTTNGTPGYCSLVTTAQSDSNLELVSMGVAASCTGGDMGVGDVLDLHSIYIVENGELQSSQMFGTYNFSFGAIVDLDLDRVSAHLRRLAWTCRTRTEDPNET